MTSLLKRSKSVLSSVGSGFLWPFRCCVIGSVRQAVPIPHLSTPDIEQIKNLPKPDAEEINKICQAGIDKVKDLATPDIEQIKNLPKPDTDQIKKISTAGIDKVKNLTSPGIEPVPQAKENLSRVHLETKNRAPFF